MLTEKEIDVLRWASEGLNDRQLAARLNISIGAVRYRWAAVFKKSEAYGRHRWRSIFKNLRATDRTHAAFVVAKGLPNPFK